MTEEKKEKDWSWSILVVGFKSRKLNLSPAFDLAVEYSGQVPEFSNGTSGTSLLSTLVLEFSTVKSGTSFLSTLVGWLDQLSDIEHCSALQ